MGRSEDIQRRAERLKEARKAAHYTSAAAFAKSHDFSESTYRAHENGTRPLTVDAARAYAGPLGVTWQYLYSDDGDHARGATGAPPPPRPRRRGDPIWTVEEVDVRARMGNALLPGDLEGESVVAEWHIPRKVIEGHTRAGPDVLRIITVIGDSMVPDFLPGERILVDTSDRNPTPPGVFVIWDGFGMVVKRLEMVPYSDPPAMRLVSKNKEYDDRELPASSVEINGRVIGKWLWT